MGIVEVKVGVIRAELPRSVGTARAHWEDRAGVLIILRDEEGRIGLGEASPLPGYSPDTLEQCEAALRSVASVIRETGALPLVPPDAPPAARFALETAGLDLAAQAAGKSLGEFFLGRRRASVPRCGLIDGMPATWANTARELMARGIRVMKVKVGWPGVSIDVLRAELRALRKVVGDCTLRLDANGAWSPSEAALRLGALASSDVEFVEQPTAPGGLERMGEAALPWAADESLRNPHEVERLLKSSCSVFVLKPAVLGGVVACGLLAARAHEHEIGAVASHLFDGPVALAACAELALSLPGRPLASGVDTHAALAAWPPIDIPQLARPGEIVTSPWPGLGFSDQARQEIASWIP